MKALLLPIAWIWILVPLGWGVYQSVQKSRPLFGLQAQGAVPATPAAPPPPAKPQGR